MRSEQYRKRNFQAVQYLTIRPHERKYRAQADPAASQNRRVNHSTGVMRVNRGIWMQILNL